MDICTATSNLTWGNFQSLIQLSAALNAAFYALADLLQRDFEIEERRINVLIAKLRRRGDDDAKIRADLSKTHLLLGELKHIERRYAAAASRVFRPLCIFAFLGAAVLLVVSSFAYNTELPFVGAVFIILSALPFFSAIIFAMIVQAYLKFGVQAARLQLTSKLEF